MTNPEVSELLKPNDDGTFKLTAAGHSLLQRALLRSVKVVRRLARFGDNDCTRRGAKMNLREALIKRIKRHIPIQPSESWSADELAIVLADDILALPEIIELKELKKRS